MKRVIVFITLALLTISCIFICLLLFGRYSVEIAYVLTKAGVLSTIDSSQQTSPNAPILSDTFLTDKEYISYSTRDAYNTDVNKMSKGITAIDPDGNRFAIEKDFIEAKRRYLESKGVYINYPYIDTFHKILKIVSSKGYDINAVNKTFDSFCYNLDKIPSGDLTKIDSINHLMSLFRDGDHKGIDAYILSLLQSDKSDIRALLIKLDLSLSSKSYDKVFSQIVLLIDAIDKIKDPNIDKHIPLGYCLAVGRQFAFEDSETLRELTTKEISPRITLHSLHVLYYLETGANLRTP